MSEPNSFDNATKQENPDVIEVGIGDQVIAQAPSVLETTAMGPCIGIFVYDERIKEAMADHFAHPTGSVQIPGLAAFLDATAARYSDKERIRIWVGGAAPDEKDFGNTATYDELKQKRSLVTDSLAERGFPSDRTTVRWSDSSSESLSMHLDLSTGEMEYNVEEEKPLHEE
jgi:hypothetical protein